MPAAGVPDRVAVPSPLLARVTPVGSEPVSDRVAVNGEEALVEISHERPDLVLTDVQMPRMDGFELTEAIRKQAALASLPVIILTSRGSDEDRRRGLECGADGYIVKSGFDQSALLSAVERLLGEDR